MFMFLEAKHGFSSEESRPKRPRRDAQKLGDGSPSKSNRQRSTFPQPSQRNIEKWKKEVDARLRIINDSLERQEGDEDDLTLSAVRLDGPVSERLEPGEQDMCGCDSDVTSRVLQQRRHSETPKCSLREVSCTDSRRGSLPVFATLPQSSSTLRTLNDQIINSSEPIFWSIPFA